MTFTIAAFTSCSDVMAQHSSPFMTLSDRCAAPNTFRFLNLVVFRFESGLNPRHGPFWICWKNVQDIIHIYQCHLVAFKSVRLLGWPHPDVWVPILGLVVILNIWCLSQICSLKRRATGLQSVKILLISVMVQASNPRALVCLWCKSSLCNLLWGNFVNCKPTIICHSMKQPARQFLQSRVIPHTSKSVPSMS